jgi:hypothetical protein
MRRLRRGESGYRDMAAFLNGSGENDHPSCGPSICPSEPRLISSSLRSLLCGTNEFGVEAGGATVIPLARILTAGACVER